MERVNFALLIGYVGSDKNNETRVRRLEAEEEVPRYIGKLVWLICEYVKEHGGSLPHFPDNLRIEGEVEPWK